LAKRERRYRRFPAGSEDLISSLHIRGQTLPHLYEPEQYAQWFFQFLRSDLRSLTAGQQLGTRADVLVFARPELLRGCWSTDDGLPPIELLETLQRDARAGIQCVRRGEWFELEAGIGYGVAIFGDRLIRGARRGTFKDLFLAAVIDTLQTSWNRLYECPQCHEIFLKVGKQKYCSSKCANRAHWQKFKAHRPSRDHHTEYVRRTRQRIGANVKINPRRKK